MIKNGDNVILKFSTIWDGELCRDHGKAYIYPSMDRAMQYYHPDHEVLVEYAPVKHGYWIEGLDGSYMCSECNRVFRYEIGHYCSSCGARLEYEEDGK